MDALLNLPHTGLDHYLSDYFEDRWLDPDNYLFFGYDLDPGKGLYKAVEQPDCYFDAPCFSYLVFVLIVHKLEASLCPYFCREKNRTAAKTFIRRKLKKVYPSACCQVVDVMLLKEREVKDA